MKEKQADMGVIKKKRISGLGIARGAKQLKEEKEPHEALWKVTNTS